MSQFKQNEYAPLGELVFTHLNRDLAEFSKVSTKINAEYLNNFETSIINVKELAPGTVYNLKQTKQTNQLYADADALKNDFMFLKTFAGPVNIPQSEFSALVSAVNSRDIEKAVDKARTIISITKGSVETLAANGMPDGFFTALTDKTDALEKSNNEQNALIQARPQSTADSQRVRNELYAYITEVCKLGKLIYTNNALKKKDYTISELIKRLRAK